MWQRTKTTITRCFKVFVVNKICMMKMCKSKQNNILYDASNQNSQGQLRSYSF